MTKSKKAEPKQPSKRRGEKNKRDAHKGGDDLEGIKGEPAPPPDRNRLPEPKDTRED